MRDTKLNDTHFQVLGVTRSATQKQIRIAYIRDIKKWHPDKFAHNSKEHVRATELCKEINEAYQLLKNYEPAPNGSQHTEHTGHQHKAQDKSNHRPDERNTQSKEPPKTETQKKSSPYSGDFIQVDSSLVQAVAYKAEAQTLIIEHRNRLFYEFYNVPPPVFLNFLLSESKGKFMMKHIWESYDYAIKHPN